VGKIEILPRVIDRCIAESKATSLQPSSEVVCRVNVSVSLIAPIPLLAQTISKLLNAKTEWARSVSLNCSGIPKDSFHENPPA
jgi:hypothetical protein